MIEHIPAADRHFRDHGWLQSYWLFSFGDYYDPHNVHHGMLRVFNDDIVAPGRGFGRHPHEEMEIVSVVLSGEMVHQDSMGNRLVIRAGDVQRMTAGTGLFHSEMNEAAEPVHFYQIWIYPDRKGLEPSYDQKSYSDRDWCNCLALLAAPGISGAVHLNSDGRIYRGRLDRGCQVTHSTSDRRNVLVYVGAGEVDLAGVRLSSGDQARLAKLDHFTITALSECDLLLVDVPGLS